MDPFLPNSSEAAFPRHHSQLSHAPAHAVFVSAELRARSYGKGGSPMRRRPMTDSHQSLATHFELQTQPEVATLRSELGEREKEISSLQADLSKALAQLRFLGKETGSGPEPSPWKAEALADQPGGIAGSPCGGSAFAARVAGRTGSNGLRSGAITARSCGVLGPRSTSRPRQAPRLGTPPAVSPQASYVAALDAARTASSGSTTPVPVGTSPVLAFGQATLPSVRRSPVTLPSQTFAGAAATISIPCQPALPTRRHPCVVLPPSRAADQTANGFSEGDKGCGSDPLQCLARLDVRRMGPDDDGEVSPLKLCPPLAVSSNGSTGTPSNSTWGAPRSEGGQAPSATTPGAAAYPPGSADTQFPKAVVSYAVCGMHVLPTQACDVAERRPLTPSSQMPTPVSIPLSESVNTDRDVASADATSPKNSAQKSPGAPWSPTRGHGSYIRAGGSGKVYWLSYEDPLDLQRLNDEPSIHLSAKVAPSPEPGSSVACSPSTSSARGRRASSVAAPASTFSRTPCSAPPVADIYREEQLLPETPDTTTRGYSQRTVCANWPKSWRRNSGPELGGSRVISRSVVDKPHPSDELQRSNRGGSLVAPTTTSDRIDGDAFSSTPSTTGVSIPLVEQPSANSSTQQSSRAFTPTIGPAVPLARQPLTQVARRQLSEPMISGRGTGGSSASASAATTVSSTGQSMVVPRPAIGVALPRRSCSPPTYNARYQQAHSSNLHDDASGAMSAVVPSAQPRLFHVTPTVLPVGVLDTAPQHHGTALVRTHSGGLPANRGSAIGGCVSFCCGGTNGGCNRAASARRQSTVSVSPRTTPGAPIASTSPRFEHPW
eukprot:TRINITY_DN26902_c0_g1_i3.p1 TRINITY_DN26902_c0_g1~~TRINITY_DN26902_c0_g1_i3.p1  ORF type:complete len:832 (+),score=102.59 TRINITY_DN26902_c0_g1_i3:110-2605(+)